VYTDIMIYLVYDMNNITCTNMILHGMVYLFSFSIMGHMCTDIGRYAWMVLGWKCMVIIPVMLGIWTDSGVAAFLIDTSTDIHIAETDKDMGDTLNSLLGLRSVLLQLLPVTTILSLYVQSTAIAPLYVTSQRLLQLLPPMLVTYNEAWTMAVESELLLHCRSLEDCSRYKDFHIEDWVLLVLTYQKMVTESRAITYIGKTITFTCITTNIIYYSWFIQSDHGCWDHLLD